jgi:hypothetical protein
MADCLDGVSTEDLIVMMRHCPENSCDGCPGVKNHCTGRIDMMYAVATHLELRMAQIKGMNIRIHNAEGERDRLRDEKLMCDRGGNRFSKFDDVGFGERYLRD